MPCGVIYDYEATGANTRQIGQQVLFITASSQLELESKILPRP